MNQSFDKAWVVGSTRGSSVALIRVLSDVIYATKKQYTSELLFNILFNNSIDIVNVSQRRVEH